MRPKRFRPTPTRYGQSGHELPRISRRGGLALAHWDNEAMETRAVCGVRVCVRPERAKGTSDTRGGKKSRRRRKRGPLELWVQWARHERGHDACYKGLSPGGSPIVCAPVGRGHRPTVPPCRSMICMHYGGDWALQRCGVRGRCGQERSVDQ